jgi:hypothetical protein
VAARERFLASAFREAATGLHAAAAETVEHLVRDERPLAVELLHWAAACSLLAGDRDVARDDLRRALVIAPDARPPPASSPPRSTAFFEEVRAAAVVATPRVFVVRSVPAGARVEVNGRDEGVTPVTVRLAPGVHALRLERLGYRLWVGPLRVEAGATPDPQIVLTEARGTELRAQVARPDGLLQVPDEATLDARPRRVPRRPRRGRPPRRDAAGAPRGPPRNWPRSSSRARAPWSSRRSSGTCGGSSSRPPRFGSSPRAGEGKWRPPGWAPV